MTISNEQLTALITAIGLLLTYFNARGTASSGAVTALSSAIATLRQELLSEAELRKSDKIAYEAALQAEKAERENDHMRYMEALGIEARKRRKLEEKFELERARYRDYIQQLRNIMVQSGILNIPDPVWETEEEKGD